MKVLVTGGSGTLGRAVCKELHQRGHKTVAYSRDPSRQLKHCPNSVHVVGDISDFYGLRHAMRQNGVEMVVHTAAIKHVDVCEKNPSLATASIVGGTENVLRAIESLEKQVVRAVFVSSDKACHRDQIYGMCKYLSEQVVKQYSHRLGCEVNSIRFGNLFGSEGSVIPIWCEKMKKDQDISLRAFPDKDGYPLRFAMLPSDAAKRMVSALFDDEMTSGTVLCPAAVPVVSMKNVVDSLLRILGSKSRLTRCPSLPGEEQYERIFSKSEGRNVRSHESYRLYEILDHRNTVMDIDWELITRHEDCINETKTDEFIQDVIQEMTQWM